MPASPPAPQLVSLPTPAPRLISLEVIDVMEVVEVVMV